MIFEAAFQFHIYSPCLGSIYYTVTLARFAWPTSSASSGRGGVTASSSAPSVRSCRWPRWSRSTWRGSARRWSPRTSTRSTSQTVSGTRGCSSGQFKKLSLWQVCGKNKEWMNMRIWGSFLYFVIVTAVLKCTSKAGLLYLFPHKFKL